MQVRYLARYSRISWFILILALVSFSVSPWAQNQEEFSLPSAQVLSDSPFALTDFDGDWIADSLTLDRTGWQLSVEIHLSHTQAVFLLPMEPSLSAAGSLTIRDLDYDGDTDLFWKGALPLAPPEVIVWFNDGTGRFARLLSLNSPHTEPTPGYSLKKDSRRVGPHHEVLPSQRTSSPASLPLSDWTRQTSTSIQREQLTAIPVTAFLKRHPSDRGPPLLF